MQKVDEGESDGNCVGYAAMDSSSGLKAWRFKRRELRGNDVKVQLTYSGICHSDIHQVRRLPTLCASALPAP